MKWLGQTLRANQKLANRLLFELPEKGILGHLDKAIKFVEISKKYKVKIVIDRFGASHSPIDYLRKVSPEFIKIDGSYILDIENDTEDQVMLKAYVDIAHGLDIKVIATFVETKEARAVVEEQGVDAVQGRLLGPPI
jgi:EAL domain-containing protein (putative c-di-GMP-specific phosphodiesterase class I)